MNTNAITINNVTNVNNTVSVVDRPIILALTFVAKDSALWLKHSSDDSFKNGNVALLQDIVLVAINVFSTGTKATTRAISTTMPVMSIAPLHELNNFFIKSFIVLKIMYLTS